MAQDANLATNWEVVDAFLTASRTGNFDALLAVLDPDIVFRYDPTAVPAGTSKEVTGASAVARLFAGRAQAARPILVNGTVGVVVAPHGQLLFILDVIVRQGKISEINAIADPTRLGQLYLHL